MGPAVSFAALPVRGGDPNFVAGPKRNLFAVTAGFIRQPGLRSVLDAAGWTLRYGLPQPQDSVVVWGRSRDAWRGESLARWRASPLIRIEDAFLRSVHPGRARNSGAPLGLLIDSRGVHYDSQHPSDIEDMLTHAPLTDAALLHRAHDGIARLRSLSLSKYNDFDGTQLAPNPGYVLVIDQTMGDASIRYGGASAADFARMLAQARADHPGKRIVIRSHPETRAGLRPGHFGPEDADTRTNILTTPVSPWQLIDGAVAVYAVTSLMGFEAILAGHRPVLFGQPFYAGWGLSDDRNPPPRRGRPLTAAQVFAVSHILAPVWYSPGLRRRCSFEEAVDQLEADTRAWRADHHGYIATGMRMWKRRSLQQIFGRERPMRFIDPAEVAATHANQTARPLMIWAGQDRTVTAQKIIRVEDGFLRSRGLGADLIPPLSLVTDQQGIYYDPTRPSDFETCIATPLTPAQRMRADHLIQTVLAAHLSKYNLTAKAMPPLPPGHRILVPGQVEDDASIRLGAGETCTNLTFLARVRSENPHAVIIFKPHPDVETGLRPGAIDPAKARQYADVIAPHADPIALIDAVDEVWTMTSLLGFEALLRSKPVTTTGAPFYAGWGLTRDLAQTPPRRQARPDLTALAYAALIAYPRYFDPMTRRPCPPEVIVERLSNGPWFKPGPFNRALAKAQGRFAHYAWIWRRQR